MQLFPSLSSLRLSSVFSVSSPIVLVSIVSLVGCGGQEPPAAAPEPSVTPAPEASAPSDSAAEPPAPSAETEAPTAEPAPGGEGRLQFVQCESPRKAFCTKEYRPVCAEVDTGIRCIKEPCPSSEKKQYGNGCMACADEKVVGYFPRACEELNSADTPQAAEPQP